MKFGHTIIYVEDVLKTIDFYQKAFSLKLKFLHESNSYAEMDTGETALAFAQEKLAQSHGLSFKANKRGEIAAGFEIAFVSDDVEAAFQVAIEAGAKSLSLPELKPWGQTVSYCSDINGVIVEICSKM